MKKIAIAVALLVVLAVGFVAYNVWRAEHDAAPDIPGKVDEGRQQLHAQLEQTRQYEGNLEKQAWNSPAKLEQLIKWHKDRIEKLQSNSQAGEILAYDRDSVTRLQNRITVIAEEEKARAEAAEAAAKAAAAAAKESEAPAQQQQP